MADDYVDDPNIHDDCELWRRICPHWIVPDQNTKSVRVSSMAFDNSKDGTPLSVLDADKVKAGGRDEQKVLQNYPGYGLTSITAGQARKCQQGVAPDPLPDEPAHTYVFGKKTKRIKRDLAKLAKLKVHP